MDEYLVRTAKALEMARMRSGLSQQKLAAKMGVNRGTVANWEQGLAAISLPMAMRWFTCCGVSVARYMDACIHLGETEGSHRCYDGVFLLRNRCPAVHQVRRSRFRPHRRTDGNSGKPPHAVEGQGRCLPDGVW